MAASIARPQGAPGHICRRDTLARMARSWKARTPRPIWFSDAHEAEAKEAQLRKPPSRFGTWVLRHLGYRGETGGRRPHGPTRHSHERPVHRPPEV